MTLLTSTLPSCCRKKCQMLTNVILLAAALLVGFSKRAGSFEMVFLGRLLYGVGIGTQGSVS